ncbi:hypothetical protein GZH47_10275 [Paenibacillus rhizovicinus]|uniref:Uncharacterized protein n=1 Tax=Paenibacillus rhizovicinus TaxID=2704463 RepID=A0A6C0NZ43_9BACL|nr:hypothetical protein [Paenibacillus rhizovicinus]QHW31206.1 hypothetical protein GZH47_10275 [Paenibacillus rhizovicinus]
MGRFKLFLTKFTIELFLLVFIYPAIVFALLVLGFTSSWKSGTLMLVSALLLRFVLKREAAAIRPGFRKSRTRTRARRSRGGPASKALRPFPGVYDHEASPPQLSDIYYDIAAQMKEQEALLAMLKAQEKRQEEWKGPRQEEWGEQRPEGRPERPVEREAERQGQWREQRHEGRQEQRPVEREAERQGQWREQRHEGRQEQRQMERKAGWQEHSPQAQQQVKQKAEWHAQRPEGRPEQRKVILQVQRQERNPGLSGHPASCSCSACSRSFQ